MNKKRGNNSVPPYISRATSDTLFGGLINERPRVVDDEWLRKIGVSPGNVFPAMSALRWMGIIKSNNEIANPRWLDRLANPQQRTEAYLEIVDSIYSDLLRQTDLENATTRSIELYFRVQGVKPSMSDRVARFFVWIAQQAGYKIGDQAESALPSENGVETPEKDDEIDLYEEELLKILLDNLRESKQVPDTELLKEIKGLIETVKGQRPPDTG